MNNATELVIITQFWFSSCSFQSPLPNQTKISDDITSGTGFSDSVRQPDLVLRSADAASASRLLPDPDPEERQPVPTVWPDLHGVRQIGAGGSQRLRTG